MMSLSNMRDQDDRSQYLKQQSRDAISTNAESDESSNARSDQIWYEEQDESKDEKWDDNRVEKSEESEKRSQDYKNETQNKRNFVVDTKLNAFDNSHKIDAFESSHKIKRISYSKQS